MDNRINNYWIHWGEEKAERKCDHRAHPVIGVEDNQTDTLSDTSMIPLWTCSYRRRHERDILVQTRIAKILVKRMTLTTVLFHLIISIGFIQRGIYHGYGYKFHPTAVG